jgi:DNA-binding IclR family transcriptional regulator
MSTLANARDVLRLMADLQRDLTVTDVATELGVPKSSVSRTLSMMADYGFLERDPVTLAYRPGGLIMEASYHYRGSHNVVSLLGEELTALVQETGYTGYVNLLDGAESLVIQMRTGRVGSLQVYTPEGTRAPAYASSMGRAILARLGDDDVSELVGNRFERAVGSAPRNRKELLARLAKVRVDGWSLSLGEIVPNVAGISAAVLDPDSGRPYGIGIALPAHQLEQTHLESLGRAVRDAAMRVGRRIGDGYWLSFVSEPEAAASTAG